VGRAAWCHAQHPQDRPSCDHAGPRFMLLTLGMFCESNFTASYYDFILLSKNEGSSLQFIPAVLRAYPFEGTSYMSHHHHLTTREI